MAGAHNPTQVGGIQSNREVIEVDDWMPDVLYVAWTEERMDIMRKYYRHWAKARRLKVLAKRLSETPGTVITLDMLAKKAQRMGLTGGAR